MKARDPAGPIDVLCQPPLTPLFQAMSAVNEVIESPLTAEDLAPLARTRLSLRLALRRYDRAYVLDEAATPALAPWLARIPERFGINSGLRMGLITHPLAEHAHRASRVDHFAALAFAADAPLPTGLRPPQLDRVPALDTATLCRLGLPDLSQDEPLILLAPGAEAGPNREWPARHYVTLAQAIRRQWPNAIIGLLGSRRDRALANQITLLAGVDLHNWAGNLDIAATLALLARADGLVSGESDLMHLAAALGRPHVAIYGGGDPRAERIADRRRTVLWLRLACSPCAEDHCPLGHLNCLQQQSPEAVLEALNKTLRFSATV